MILYYYNYGMRGCFGFLPQRGIFVTQLQSGIYLEEQILHFLEACSATQDFSFQGITTYRFGMLSVDWVIVEIY